MNEEQYASIRADLARNEQEHESYNRRLHEHDEAIRELQTTQIQIERLTNAVNNLSEGVRDMKTTVQRVDQRVADLEKRPLERWQKIGFEILKWAVIGALTFGAGCIYQKLRGGI